MRYNEKMKYLLEKYDVFSKPNFSLLNAKSRELVEKDTCIVLKEPMELNKHLTLSFFEDEIAYELAINSFHLRDYVKRNRLPAAYWFLKVLFQEWHIYHPQIMLVGIITCIKHDVVLRFYRHRENSGIIAEEIRTGIGEAVLKFTSTDVEVLR